MAERLGLSGQIDGADPYYTAPDGTRYLVNGVSVNVDPNQFEQANRFVDPAVWERIRNDPSLMITTPDGKQAFREDLMLELAKYYPSSGLNNDEYWTAMLKFATMVGGPILGATLFPGTFAGGVGDVFPIGADTLGTIGGGGFAGVPGVTDLPTVPDGWDLPDFPAPETPGIPNTPTTPGTPTNPTGPGLPEIPKVPPIPPGSPGGDTPVDPNNGGWSDGWEDPITPGNGGTNTPSGRGWLDRILAGEGTATDWARFFGPGAGAVLDYFGDQAQGDAATDWYNTVMNSPSMRRFEDSYKPGWSILDADPAFQGALDASANAFTRAASSRVGNVGGNPGAWNEIQTNVMNNTLVPWTNTYRSQQLSGAGMGANIAGTFAGPSINSAGSAYDNAGAFLGSMYKPQSGFSIDKDGKITWNSGSGLS